MGIHPFLVCLKGNCGAVIHRAVCLHDEIAVLSLWLRGDMFSTGSVEIPVVVFDLESLGVSPSAVSMYAAALLIIVCAASLKPKTVYVVSPLLLGVHRTPTYIPLLISCVPAIADTRIPPNNST